MKKVVTLFVLLVVLVVAFAGCGAPANTVNGIWYDKAGLAGTIDFKADGNCTLSAMGMSFDATYKFDAAKGEGTLTLMGTDLGFTLKNGELVTSDGSSVTTYTRTEVKQQDLTELMEGLGEAMEGLGN